MSLESWKREFYRKPANEVSKAWALRHSLKKWIGLLSINTKKHQVYIFDNEFLINTSDVSRFMETSDRIDVFDIYGQTCAMCCNYSCLECPLGSKVCYDDNSPFGKFIDNGRPTPMINAIKKAINRKEKK